MSNFQATAMIEEALSTDAADPEIVEGDNQP